METDFIPDRKWNTIAESSAAFHVVGARRTVTRADPQDLHEQPLVAGVDKLSTESTVCFHSRRAN
jgi:hypothetical protein